MFNTLWNTFCPKFYHKFKFDMLKCAEMIWNAFKVSRIVLSGMPGVQISLAGGAAGVDQPLEWYIHPCILWWLYTCRTLPEATTEEVIYDICDFFFAIFAAVQFVCALPHRRDLSGANCGVSKFIQNWLGELLRCSCSKWAAAAVSLPAQWANLLRVLGCFKWVGVAGKSQPVSCFVMFFVHDVWRPARHDADTLIVSLSLASWQAKLFSPPCLFCRDPSYVLQSLAPPGALCLARTSVQ